MRRRITTAVIGVTALALLALGLPLGIVVGRLVREQAVLRLEREAGRAALEVGIPLTLVGDDPTDLPPPEDRTTLGLYDPAGTLVVGAGPRRADAVTSQAAAGMVADGTAGGDLVVAVPVVSNEEVAATVRAATRRSAVDGLVRLAQAGVLLTALVVLLLSAAVARTVADRLAAPVTALVGAMGRLRDGELTATAPRSGVAELDVAAAALDQTAERLGSMLERERAFAADASHQLRTPLAALRLAAESGLADPGSAATRLAEVVTAADRLERTVVGLLALAGDRVASAPVDLAGLVDEVRLARHGPLAAAGRRLDVDVEGDLPPVRASRAAVAEILAVLVDNATAHGTGTVTVAAVRSHAGALVVSVADEGRLRFDAGAVFGGERRPDGHGLGLALARRLAEAEGGRLVAEADPSCFRLVLPLTGDPTPITS